MKNKKSAYILMPKELFYSERYSSLTPSAKILYCTMLDRLCLSRVNGWQDDNGKTFIIYTIKAVCSLLNCSKKTALKFISELENVNLIEKGRVQSGAPTFFYVNQIKEEEKITPGVCKNYTQTGGNITPEAVEKLHPNNTENNKTEFNNTYSTSYDEIVAVVKENIEFDCFGEEDRLSVENIVSIIAQTLCTDTEEIIIGGRKYSYDVVKSRLMELDSEHINYVLDCINRCENKIRSISGYTLKLLFEAPATMELHYTALYAADRNGKSLP